MYSPCYVSSLQDNKQKKQSVASWRDEVSSTCEQVFHGMTVKKRDTDVRFHIATDADFKETYHAHFMVHNFIFAWFHAQQTHQFCPLLLFIAAVLYCPL